MRSLFSLSFVTCLLLISNLPLKAGPTDAELGELKKPLSKEIQVQFFETPLSRAIDYLQRESGVSFIIEHKGNPAVHLEVKKMTVRKALDWTCRLTGTDWYIEDGMVIIDSKSIIYGRKSVTRYYDFSSVNVQLPSFEQSEVGGIQMDTIVGGGGSLDIPSIDGDEGDFVDVETLIEDVSSLITENVGDFEEWARNGGELSSMRRFNDGILIKTIPENHVAITKLLHAIETFKTRMVQVDAKMFLMDTPVVESLVKKNGSSHLFSAAKYLELIKELENKEKKQLAASRMVAFNARRMAFTSGMAKYYQASSASDRMTGSILESEGVLNDALDFSVEPIMSLDQKSIILTFRANAYLNGGWRERKLPVGLSSRFPQWVGKGELTGSIEGDSEHESTIDEETVHEVKSKAGEKIIMPHNRTIIGDIDLEQSAELKLKLSKEGAEPKPGHLVSTSYELPSQEYAVLRSTGRVPDEGALLISMGSVSQPGKELVLILSPKILSEFKGLNK